MLMFSTVSVGGCLVNTEKIVIINYKVNINNTV